MSELRWYYGPTDWDPEPGHMWHSNCPAGRGEVMYDKDGGVYCLGCGADQEPDSAGPVRPDEEPGARTQWKDVECQGLTFNVAVEEYGHSPVRPDEETT